MYWNGIWGLLKYLQCNKANAEKFQNIFMWNALILVLVGMPQFQFGELRKSKICKGGGRDTFILKRTPGQDDFYNLMNGKFCGEAWDAISRYVYSALQGGSIMRKWTNDDRMMIACCNDGTRPVIFKIERIDIAENEEEKEWLAKQNFKNTADEIQNCYANKFSKNLVQERHDQRVIIKSYRQCMATAGCFSELGFIYMILLWR